MTKRLVYLCGPITGMTYDNARFGWRHYMAEMLTDLDIDCLSPMRFEEELATETTLKAVGYEDNIFASARGIVARDRFDTQRADLVVSNLLGAKRVSIGSMIEFGWCDSMRIPLVCIMEPEGNVHEHAMVNEMIDFRVTNLDDAVDAIARILTPGV